MHAWQLNGVVTRAARAAQIRSLVVPAGVCHLLTTMQIICLAGLPYLQSFPEELSLPIKFCLSMDQTAASAAPCFVRYECVVVHLFLILVCSSRHAGVSRGGGTCKWEAFVHGFQTANRALQWAGACFVRLCL